MTSADIIIANAKVLTMDPARPRAEGVAISGNRILRVGSNKDVASLKAKHTRMIDAGMKTVMPGIVEGHVHLFGGAVKLGSLMLNNINGLNDVAEAVSQFRKTRPHERVIVATGIAHESFGAGTPITRQLLDRIVNDVPFIAVCFDHHTVWANCRALEAAGIMKGRALPAGNEIVVDGNGLATGELDARVEIPFHQKNYFEPSRIDEAVAMRAQYQGGMLHSGRVKIFIDGVLETMTALMLDEYPGHPGNTGAPCSRRRNSPRW